MKDPWKSLGPGAVIMLLTIAAYIPALRCGFVWDDDFYVTRNQALRSLEGLGRIWTQPGMGSEMGPQQYYPLSFTGLWVQYLLWGLRPFGYHLVNVLLHAVNAVLLWRVLRRLEVPGSWWAAIIFALHPVQVESVAWITEFKNVSSGTFSLLSLLAFLQFHPLSASTTTAAGDSRYYVLALLLFVCGLLSKTAVCCLPVVVVVLMWWKQRRVAKEELLALIPWFVVSLGFGLITLRVESRLPEVSTTGSALSIAQRVLLAGRALWFYAGKVFWPHPLTFVYPRWNIDPGAAWQYSFPLALVAGVAALWLLRRRIGKGPLAGVLCFAAMLLPVLGFLNIYFFRYAYVTDHFQYLASISLITLAVSGVGVPISRRIARSSQGLGTLAGPALLLILGLSTWRQAHVYQDLETLWRDTLAKNPDSWLAQYNLGNLLLRSGRPGEALIHYERVLRIKPDYAEADNNWGLALAQMGRFQDAIGHYQRSLQVAPGDAVAHYNLGIALKELGRLPEAVGQWEQAVRLKPDFAEAHNNLGSALAHLGRVPEAITHWEQAVQLKPDFAEAHRNLAMALDDAGRVQEAVEHYEQALRIQPGMADARDRLTQLRAAQ